MHPLASPQVPLPINPLVFPVCSRAVSRVHNQRVNQVASLQLNRLESRVVSLLANLLDDRRLSLPKCLRSSLRCNQVEDRVFNHQGDHLLNLLAFPHRNPPTNRLVNPLANHLDILQYSPLVNHPRNHQEYQPSSRLEDLHHSLLWFLLASHLSSLPVNQVANQLVSHRPSQQDDLLLNRQGLRHGNQVGSQVDSQQESLPCSHPVNHLTLHLRNLQGFLLANRRALLQASPLEYLRDNPVLSQLVSLRVNRALDLLLNLRGHRRVSPVADRQDSQQSDRPNNLLLSQLENLVFNHLVNLQVSRLLNPLVCHRVNLRTNQVDSPQRNLVRSLLLILLVSHLLSQRVAQVVNPLEGPVYSPLASLRRGRQCSRQGCPAVNPLRSPHRSHLLSRREFLAANLLGNPPVNPLRSLQCSLRRCHRLSPAVFLALSRAANRHLNPRLSPLMFLLLSQPESHPCNRLDVLLPNLQVNQQVIRPASQLNVLAHNPLDSPPGFLRSSRPVDRVANRQVCLLTSLRRDPVASLLCNLLVVHRLSRADDLLSNPRVVQLFNPVLSQLLSHLLNQQ